MEIVLIILLFLNMALLAAILVFMYAAVDLIRNDNTPAVVSTITSTPPVQDEPDKVTPDEFEDESVPLEQFTPDFTKPITFKPEVNTSIDEVEE